MQPRFVTQMNEDFSRNNPGKIVYAGGHSRAEMFARSGTAVFGTWI